MSNKKLKHAKATAAVTTTNFRSGDSWIFNSIIFPRASDAQDPKHFAITRGKGDPPGYVKLRLNGYVVMPVEQFQKVTDSMTPESYAELVEKIDVLRRQVEKPPSRLLLPKYLA